MTDNTPATSLTDDELVDWLRRASRAFMPGGKHETRLLWAAARLEALHAEVARQREQP